MASSATTSAVVPTAEPDLQNPAVVIDLFTRAAEANRKNRRRKGCVVHLPKRGHLLITGDLHDHGLNFQRAVHLAQLHRSKDRHLVLHEVIHGRTRISGKDFSIRLLARIAALKLQYPSQVHLIQSNHELAQYWGDNISKGGINSVECFNEGVEFLYGDEAGAVLEAMNKFLRSYAVAIKCANGVFISHSLPGIRQMDTFDPTVLDREPTDDDMRRGGSVYSMVWGRNHPEDIAEELGELWGVHTFVMGHQPAEMGYQRQGESMLILASDHEHGMALPMKLTKEYRRDDLVRALVPLSTVVL